MKSLMVLNSKYSAPAMALLLSLIVSACKPQSESAGAGKPPPSEVAVLTVSEQSTLLVTELPGRTAPFRIAEIRPQVNGLIQRRLFEEGSDVKAGQPLYQIDPAPFQVALDNAKAALGRAEANLPAVQSRAERYKQALADRAVSQQDYDDIAAALKQAQADVEYYKAMVETARINLGYAQVASPIAGRIGVSAVTDGAIVTAYQPLPLASIQQLDPIYVDIPHSATEWLRLQRRWKEGHINRETGNINDVELFLPDGTKYDQKGALQFRDVSVDPSMGTVTVRMVFPNPNGVLLPGMFVRAVLREGVNQHAILVPQQVVSRDPTGNPIALVVDAQNLVQQRPLELDRAIGDKWLVTSGLKPGEAVIAEGSQKVRPGAEVKTVPFREGGSQPAPAAAPAPTNAPQQSASAAQEK